MSGKVRRRGIPVHTSYGTYVQIFMSFAGGSTSPNASSIGYTMSETDTEYQYSPMCYFPIQRAAVSLTKDELTGDSFSCDLSVACQCLSFFEPRLKNSSRSVLLPFSGRGRVVIKGPKEKASGAFMGGEIVLPRGADLTQPLEVIKTKGLKVCVKKLAAAA